MKGLACLALVVALASGVQGAAPLPLLELTGDIRVIMLFDFHRHLHPNGTCVDMDYEAVQVGQAVVWAYDWLKASGKFRDLGPVSLEVYDTCGSAGQALKILSGAVSSSLVRTSKRLAGVISFTGEAVGKQVDEFLTLMSYLHVQVSGSDPAKGRQDRVSTIQMPSPSASRARALGAAMQLLNWTQLSVITLDDPDSRREANQFIQMASEFDICISSTSTVPSVEDIFRGTYSTKGSLAFVGHLSENTSVAAEGATEEQWFVLTGMETLPDRVEVIENSVGATNDSTRTFFIAEIANITEALEEDFVSPLSARSSSLGFLEAVFQCSSSTKASCQAKLDDYFSLRPRHSSVRRGSDGFQIALEVIQRLQDASCQDFNFQRCDLTLESMDHSSPRRNSSVVTTSPTCAQDSTLSLELLSLSGNISTVGIFQKDIFYAVNSSDLPDINGLLPASQCDGKCQECQVCRVPVKRHVHAAVQTGAVYIGGLLPMYDSRNRLSPERVVAAEAFLWAVETFSQRQFSLQTTLDIGAFVVNSPATNSESEALIRKFEDCDLAPSTGPHSDTIDSKTVLAYLKLIENDDFVSGRSGQQKSVLSLSKLGIRRNGQIRGDFWASRLSATLKTLHWTYPTIVWSEDLADNSFQQTFENELREKEICLAVNYVLRMESMAHSTVAEALLSNSARSSVVILMTDLSSTIDFLRTFDTYNGSALQFVLFPWNSDALLYIPTNIALGSVSVAFKPLENVNFDNHLKRFSSGKESRNAWLEHLRSDMCQQKCGSSVDTIECWENWVEQSAELSSHIIDVTDSLLLTVNAEFNDKCRNTLDGCDLAKLLRDSIGEMEAIFQLDIVNAQLDVEGNLDFKKVGEFQANGEIDLPPSSVLSYDFAGEVISAKSECSGWCPSCQPCSDTSLSLDKYLYSPGDVVIVGVFPVHKDSGTHLSCDKFNPQGYLDAESFHFAVRNIRNRYPEILSNVTIGSLIVDSCQSPDRIVQLITNFETCKETYKHGQNSLNKLNPRMVIGYVDYDHSPVFFKSADVLGRHERVVMTPMRVNSSEDHPTVIGTAESDLSVVEAVADLLSKNNWTYISIVISTDDEYVQQLEFLKTLASERDICIAGVYRITSDRGSLEVAYNSLYRNRGSNAIVTLLNLQNSTSFFDMVRSRNLRRVWINAGRQFAWVANNSVVALGSIFVERPKASHEIFEAYVKRLANSRTSDLPWYDDFAAIDKPARDDDAKDRTINVISTVDSLIHGFNDFYLKICPEGDGLCTGMAKLDSRTFTNDLLLAIRKSKFLSDTGKVISIEKTDCFLPGGIYDVKHFRKMDNGSLGYVKIALWDGKLRSEPDVELEFYDTYGYVRKTPISSTCNGKCDCINPLSTDIVTMGLTGAGLYGDYIYYETSGEFIGSPWAIAVVVVAGLGVSCGVILILYIISRLCIRSLKVKNVDLGLLLIFADILLFLSVLPFVVTPSHASCGMRYLLTSMSYTLCFAICLTKAMTIYEYSTVGLGGEVSRLNTFVILLFMLGVQVAISAQFWITHDDGTTLLTETTESGQILYACNFEKRTFVIYMSYVMFLLFLCVLYSFGLRGERRNLGETKLLLTCSSLCVAVWITWIVVLFTMGREFVEPSICVGIVACASLILAIMFIPKLRRLARPKQYSLQQSETKKGAGQKSQNDFVFDGPYSLPGTVRSKEKPYANSIVALSSDFFY